MKKLTIITAVLIAGTIFANAKTETQVRTPKENVKLLVTEKRATTTEDVYSGSNDNKKRITVDQKFAPPTPVTSTNSVTKTKPGNVKLVWDMPTPIFITGDKEIDAKIKSLMTEMDAKVKIIHNEYQAKILELVGKAKPTNENLPINTSNVNPNGNNVGSTTNGNIPPGPKNSGEVKGVSTTNFGETFGQGIGSRFKNILGGILGKN